MKRFFALVAIIMMAAMNVMNAQSPSVDSVDIITWSTGNASHLTADTISIEDLDFEGYKGYLPIIVRCPELAEVWDDVSREFVGFSKYIRVNAVAQLTAFVMNTNRVEQYGSIYVPHAYTCPPQMVPFTDTLRIEEGKKEVLIPWHWMPYEETFVQSTGWAMNGEIIDEWFGMKRIEIYGPAVGDTTTYVVSVRDSRVSISILNTFVVIGTEKSRYDVEETTASPMNIYPNPSNDGVITIKGDGIVEIFNILGQKVMGDMEVVNETRVFLESGLYIVRINGELSSKVIVR